MFSSFFTKAVCQASENKSVEGQSQCEIPQRGLVQSLVAGRQIAAAAIAEGDSCEFGSLHYFALCGLGGILSCGITHTAVVPLDLVKCRIQVDPAKYKSVFNGFKVTLREDGARGLAKGWAPTFFGYSAQGLCKFGLYEVFKVFYTDIIGEENAYLYRTWLYLSASATAEFFADIALSPMEAAKVKIQTTPGFANTLREAWPKIYAEEGINGFYKSLVPLWMRQIPYTMMKFACFERTVELLYKYVVPKPRADCTKGEQLIVTFAAGYIAGVFCAIVSHPADTVVSKLNQEKGRQPLKLPRNWALNLYKLSMLSCFLSKALCHESETKSIMDLRCRHSKQGLVQSLVAGRYIAAASVAEGDSCEFGSMKYFILCGLGGIISCGTTHTLVVPLDLVKCRIQVDPAKYKSIFYGFQVTMKEDGSKGLVKGWAPTFIGYSMQGLCKFGLYEVFKVIYADIIGEEAAYLYRTWLYLCASASAEFFADIALSPMEAAKVKIQTTPGFASTLRGAVPRMLAEEGIGGFYKSLVPLWMRQIPYTMTKFACFERTVELLYKHVVRKPKSEVSQGEQLIVTFAAGYIAGVFCAVISHPADTVVSKLNQEKGTTAIQAFKKLGMGGMWKGLTPRIIMIGTLTALQWFIYDAFKVAMRIPRPHAEMPESLRKKLEAAKRN
ncbi:hypothetical protein NQ314_000346 [Rhamnusium bicolor]|uniref:Phosphate carrier protein, mitochondrial n=1 Tax=Rhamnusium bicolor TaxID=1586634 RepID=A0AAV8ZYF7_9CUCU|nr:hypothetical protein NQ314_000346 [Rhamnusium bicolor]